MNESRRPRRLAGFRLVEDGEDLSLCGADGQRVRCDRPAALIWRLVDGERSIAECVALLAAAYPEDAERIPIDVRETVARLESLGVIRIEPETSLLESEAREPESE